MLVLGRRHGESITFPDFDIEIAVVEIRGNKVRLGIVAPREIAVVRTELLEGFTDETIDEDGDA